jgi:Calcineurin-like phosphoesterase
MGRVAVIGDVGGHAQELRRALAALGVGDAIPPDLVVVQVGDLIDRGPADSETLSIVDKFLTVQPGQWVQLTGNHDAQYVGGEQFWRERLPAADAHLLLRWWESGALRVAAAVLTNDGDEFLITHAGSTVGCWRGLGEPMTAAGAAMLLNDRPDLIWRGGGPLIDRAAGLFWAEAGWELHEPWMEYYDDGGLVPFGQIHGHSCIFSYSTGTWRAPERVRLRAAVDIEARHVRVRVGGRLFIGVDPHHGKAGAPGWRPLVLEGRLA